MTAVSSFGIREAFADVTWETKHMDEYDIDNAFVDVSR